jgi:hypothetical protein
MISVGMQEYTITETTVGRINGITVASGGAYKDPDDGKKKVNLWIAGIAHPGLKIGDTIQCGDQTWAIKAFKKRLFQQHGLIVLVQK